jgi:hypothetical protein
MNTFVRRSFESWVVDHIPVSVPFTEKTTLKSSFTSPDGKTTIQLYAWLDSELLDHREKDKHAIFDRDCDYAKWLFAIDTKPSNVFSLTVDFEDDDDDDAEYRHDIFRQFHEMRFEILERFKTILPSVQQLEFSCGEFDELEQKEQGWVHVVRSDTLTTLCHHYYLFGRADIAVYVFHEDSQTRATVISNLTTSTTVTELCNSVLNTTSAVLPGYSVSAFYTYDTLVEDVDEERIEDPHLPISETSFKGTLCIKMEAFRSV